MSDSKRLFLLILVQKCTFCCVLSLNCLWSGKYHISNQTTNLENNYFCDEIMKINYVISCSCFKLYTHWSVKIKLHIWLSFPTAVAFVICVYFVQTFRRFPSATKQIAELHQCIVAIGEFDWLENLREIVWISHCVHVLQIARPKRGILSLDKN